MASLILGAMGKKRSGKDTFAARLVAEHGFTRIAFADALKDVALDLDPIIDNGPFVRANGSLAVHHSRLSDIVEKAGWEAAKDRPEVRRILQALGVAMRTHVDLDVWVDAAMAKADRIPGPVVITDVRFPNEADRVRAGGGKLVRVQRPGLLDADFHVSETALDDHLSDFTVSNDGTVEGLHTQADVLADVLFGPTS